MNTKAREMTGIEQAVDRAGGQPALAALLGSRYPQRKHVSQQAISQWVKQGYVPQDRAQAVAEATGVAIQDLVSPKIRALIAS